MKTKALTATHNGLCSHLPTYHAYPPPTLRVPTHECPPRCLLFPAPQSPPHAREQRASHGTAGSHLTAYLMRQEATAWDQTGATSLPEGAANRSAAQGAAGSAALGGGESWPWQGRSPRSLEHLLLQQQQLQHHQLQQPQQQQHRHPGPGYGHGQTPQRMSPFQPGGARRGGKQQAAGEAAGPGGSPGAGAPVQPVAAGAAGVFASPGRAAGRMARAGVAGAQGTDLTGTREEILSCDRCGGPQRQWGCCSAVQPTRPQAMSSPSPDHGRCVRWVSAPGPYGTTSNDTSLACARMRCRAASWPRFGGPGGRSRRSRRSARGRSGGGCSGRCPCTLR